MVSPLTKVGVADRDVLFVYNNNNNNFLHLYSAFLDTQSALHSKGAISSSTTNVQHPPG